MDEQQQEILACYRAILESSQLMLEVASAGDWDQLIEMKSEHLCQVAALTTLEYDARVTDPFRSAKLALLQQIGAAEQQLRACLQVRMNQLSESIMQARSAQRVQHAYRNNIAS